jgi:hypothetical protein
MPAVRVSESGSHGGALPAVLLVKTPSNENVARRPKGPGNVIGFIRGPIIDHDNFRRVELPRLKKKEIDLFQCLWQAAGLVEGWNNDGQSAVA